VKRADVKGLGLIALLPICCIGLPLLVAASVSVAAVAWVGAIAALVVVVTARVRHRRSTRSLSLRITGSR